MPAHLTILRVDVAVAHVGPAHAVAQGVEGIAGEPELIASPDRATATLVVAFHLAADAVAAVERLMAAIPAEGAAPAALVTGEVELADGRHAGPARERVDALAASIDDVGVLVSASTAVMVTPRAAGGARAGRRAHQRRRTRLPAATGRSAAPAADDDAGAANLGWAHRAAAHPVIGRVGTMARLEGAWASALAGDPRLVVLSGDPGIGKTTLAAEQALRIHATRRHGAVRAMGRRAPRPVPGDP